MKPIRIGIIGTGNISHVHMNAYKQNPRVELYALCDLNRERVLAAAKAYGVPEERVFTEMCIRDRYSFAPAARPAGGMDAGGAGAMRRLLKQVRGKRSPAFCKSGVRCV